MMLLAYHVVLAAIQLEGAHVCVHFVLLLANHTEEFHVHVIVQVVVLLAIQAEGVHNFCNLVLICTF